jgi:hypothetical protein
VTRPRSDTFGPSRNNPEGMATKLDWLRKERDRYREALVELRTGMLHASTMPLVECAEEDQRGVADQRGERVMPEFRKRPVVIEARRWVGDNFDDLWCWMGGAIDDDLPEADEARYLNTLDSMVHFDDEDAKTLTISTLEDSHTANLGDWIIRGVKGEFYPCKPDIFEMTYEPTNG